MRVRCSALGSGGRLRGRACALVGRDGCEVLLCDPCVRVSRVCPGSPGVFLPCFLQMIHEMIETSG